MSAWRAFAAGVRRVSHAPAIIAGLWLSTFLLAWPLAIVLRTMLADHLGASLAAEAAASGVNHDWWNEFLAQTSGLGQTFVPAIIGFAAVLRNISSMADAEGPRAVLVAAAVAAHLLLSVFLMGGVLDRLARDRRIGAYAFFAACGQYVFRLVRLSLIAAAVYGVLFAVVHPWLFDDVFTAVTREVTVERTAIVYRFSLYLLFALLVAAANIVFDYAKVRMVVEDRRSAIGSLNGALRFLSRHGAAAAALYAINVLLFVALLGVYALVAPGASGGAAAWLGLLIGQIYIALRVAVRLLFAASAISLFQSRLAHAGYVATPVAKWPESPAAEAVIPQ